MSLLPYFLFKFCPHFYIDESHLLFSNLEKVWRLFFQWKATILITNALTKTNKQTKKSCWSYRKYSIKIIPIQAAFRKGNLKETSWRQEVTQLGGFLHNMRPVSHSCSSVSPYRWESARVLHIQLPPSSSKMFWKLAEIS